jgi:hypothetical protein
MEKTIEKLKEIERDVNSYKAKVTTSHGIQEINRVLRYLADARTALRLIGTIHMPHETSTTKDR